MKQKLAVVTLVLIGSLQMAGDLLRLPALKAFGAAIAASPAPKVFTAQNGFETYANRFFLDWSGPGGRSASVEITPHNYAGLRGPYNRRNAYGAAISYAPVLVADARTASLFFSVARYGLCGDAPLLGELGIDPMSLQAPPRLRLEPRAFSYPDQSRQLVFEVDCNE